MTTKPETGAICKYINSLLNRVGVDVREGPAGLFSLTGRTGDVRVCWVDNCMDRSIFNPADPRIGDTVYVVGNERDLGALVPTGTRSFSLVELALGTKGGEFVKELRRRLRLDDVKVARPAALSRKRSLPNPPPSEHEDENALRRQDAAEPRRGEAQAAGPAFVLFTGGRRQDITRVEYEEVAARFAEYDLYIDLAKTAVSGRYVARRKDQDGVSREASLSKNEAFALAELVEGGRAVRPKQLKSIGTMQNPDKVIETARSRVDVNLGRYDWRAFKTLPGETAKAKAFHFNPPDGFRYALIRPLPVEGDE
jgi:hypothetical protein